MPNMCHICSASNLRFVDVSLLQVSPSAEHACAEAGLVICVTPAREPLVQVNKVTAYNRVVKPTVILATAFRLRAKSIDSGSA